MKYRVEQKYIIMEDQIALLMHKLKNVMEYDAHTNDGIYSIRSLYFDDMYDSCLEDNESGNDNRAKFRIRTYNNNKTSINLEIKAKAYGYTSKEKEALTEEECEILMYRKPWTLTEQDGMIKKKLYALMAIRRMRPVQIVEYERIPFVERKGNVRITFDKNIVGTAEVTTFFDDMIPGIPVMPMGHHILEVKYDEFLPSYLKEILDTVSLHKTAFSKYYYSRVNQNLQ